EENKPLVLQQRIHILKPSSFRFPFANRTVLLSPRLRGVGIRRSKASMPPPLLRGKPGPILKYVLGQNDSSSTSGDISRRSTRLNTCFRTCHPCTTESP